MNSPANNSNMSNAERLRFVPEGILTEFPFLAQCADIEEVEAQYGALQISVDEAMACMPDEDFMEPVLKLLRNLHGNLRKSDTKDAIKHIMDVAEDLQLGIARDAEYARDQLKN